MAIPSAPTAQLTMEASNSAALSEEEILDKLEEYVHQDCSRKNDFPKEITIRDTASASIHLYSMEIFTEERVKVWATEPYRGEYINQPGGLSAVPVDIWSIYEQVPVRFGFSSVMKEVPGSISVVNCAQCVGNGTTQCGQCQGSTTGPCLDCRSTGYLPNPDGGDRQICPSCRATGRIGCTLCKRKGTVICTSCIGFKRVKNYEKMTITWKTKDQTWFRFSGHIRMNPKLLDTINRKLIVEDTSPVSVCRELTGFPEFLSSFNASIERENSIPYQRILEVRQKVFMVPATEVTYQHNGKVKQFVVYGEEELIYFPDKDPTAGCCSIM